MRRLSINTFLTLDGIMQAPGGPTEDPTGGFAYGGWSFGYWDDVMGAVMAEYMGKPFDILLGRKTYEIFAAHWPQSKEEGAEQLNNAHKYVASRTLKQLDWKNSTLLGADVVGDITQIKQGDGPEIQVHGSSDLIQTLLKNNLYDELRVWIFPVLIGSGKRLFGRGTVPSGLKLKDSKVSTSGVVIATYVPDGDIKAGSFAQGEPSEAEKKRQEKMKKEG
jgi:dihydrofolate reductase